MFEVLKSGDVVYSVKLSGKDAYGRDAYVLMRDGAIIANTNLTSLDMCLTYARHDVELQERNAKSARELAELMKMLGR